MCVFEGEWCEKTTGALHLVLKANTLGQVGSAVLFGARPAVSDTPRVRGRCQETQEGSWDMPYDSRCPLAATVPQRSTSWVYDPSPLLQSTRML